jgi:hypothetical protein
VCSAAQSAAGKAQTRRNADLYNKQLIKFWHCNQTKGGVTRISFVADRSGNMFDLQVVDSSGKESLDNAALKAVGSMVPMSDFGGEPGENYLFESVFDGKNVKTEYKGIRSFIMTVDDRLLRRPSRWG